MTRLRLRLPEFGIASCEFLKTSEPPILAHRCKLGDSSVFALHNLSGNRIKAIVSLGEHVDHVFDVLTNDELGISKGGTHRFTLLMKAAHRNEASLHDIACTPTHSP